MTLNPSPQVIRQLTDKCEQLGVELKEQASVCQHLQQIHTQHTLLLAEAQALRYPYTPYPRTLSSIPPYPRTLSSIPPYPRTLSSIPPIRRAGEFIRF